MKKIALLTLLSLGFLGGDFALSAADKADDKKVQAKKQATPDIKKKALEAFSKAKAKEIAELKKICETTDVKDLKKICPDLMKCEKAEMPGKRTSKKCMDLFKQEQDIYKKLEKESKANDSKSKKAASGKAAVIVNIKPRNRDVYYEDYYIEYVDPYGYDTFYNDDYEDEYLDDLDESDYDDYVDDGDDEDYDDEGEDDDSGDDDGGDDNGGDEE